MWIIEGVVHRYICERRVTVISGSVGEVGHVQMENSKEPERTQTLLRNSKSPEGGIKGGLMDRDPGIMGKFKFV